LGGLPARASGIDRMVRAFTPWPSAFTQLRGRTIKIVSARTAHGASPVGPPGTITKAGDGLHVATGDGVLAVLSVQAQGKKAMDADQFAAGARLEAGAHFE